MITEEKPSLEELMHYGKKGMKWGVRRKYTSAEIRDARIRTDSRVSELRRQADKLNIETARNPNSKASKAAAKEFSKMSTEFLKNPDRATAARLTRGEKVVLGLLAVGFPVAGTVGAGAAVAVRTAARRSIEKQVAKANGPEKVSRMARP